MKFVAMKQKTILADNVSIEVELKIAVPGMDRQAAQSLIDRAHEVCPFLNDRPSTIASPHIASAR